MRDVSLDRLEELGCKANFLAACGLDHGGLGCDLVVAGRDGPGCEEFRTANHDQSAAQRAYADYLRAAGSAGFQLLHVCGCGRRKRPVGPERPGTHVRAPRLQRHQRDWHDDYAAEKVALAKVEATYDAYEAEYRKGMGQDPAKLAELQRAHSDARKRRAPVRHPQPVHRNGGGNGAHDLNASTGLDSTEYFWSMPANRLELWAYMESGRLGHPVPREFYKERDVVMEERRMRTDSNPIGRMVEQFLATAYVAHPYGRPGVGWESELSPDRRHRGHGLPQEVLHTVEHRDRGCWRPESVDDDAGYGEVFQPIPAGPKPEPMTTVEPTQNSREVGHHPGRDATLLHRGLPPERLSGPG